MGSVSDCGFGGCFGGSVVILERTGDGCWYLKHTDLCGPVDDWWPLVRLEDVDCDADDEFPLPCA